MSKADVLARPAVPALLPEDYYLEGNLVVFTAQYHRKRGYCCEKGCRHCPFGIADNAGKPDAQA